MTTTSNIQALHLVTSEEVFFTQQIDTLERKGVDTTVLVVPGADQIDGDMGSGRGVAEYLQFLPKVRQELRSGNYDLIHANYGLTAPYAITQFRLPVVLTLWGSDVVGFDGAVTKACAWRCDAITVRSEEMRDMLGRDAHILPSGIDLERFEPMDRREACERVGWDPDRKHVLFPYSPDYERKNYPLAKRVTERTRDRLEATDDEIELQTISGVPHERVPIFMNAADALLLTSRHEGSPNTVKEAMACNLPVVSTDVGDVRTRLRDVSPSGVGTTEDELVDELVAVLESGRRSNGRDAVREVSWDRIGDRILDIYESVLSADESEVAG
ncbi:Glycosyltransferase involved in cell wall bisynthesis [Halobiforma haloterrestris]|uniref:Glycosyltransferase involved in cell wall bisynthesis n=1 Tax=Natronobacterium haloterrestre TaxID=148448 RepID=A0A1I1K858_NATHA|nr:glycosyltransferase [Halobiforma haloterrestris]SFC54293.1 Glycosyltransferase involved in cell wall bisynthesis [Halobiforma haloterrestris]